MLKTYLTCTHSSSRVCNKMWRRKLAKYKLKPRFPLQRLAAKSSIRTPRLTHSNIREIKIKRNSVLGKVASNDYNARRYIISYSSVCISSQHVFTSYALSYVCLMETHQHHWICVSTQRILWLPQTLKVIWLRVDHNTLVLVCNPTYSWFGQIVKIEELLLSWRL